MTLPNHLLSIPGNEVLDALRAANDCRVKCLAAGHLAHSESMC
jgi:hypothetical protein